MRKPKWARALVLGTGLMIAFASCGPSSSQTEPTDAGASALGGTPEGGEATTQAATGGSTSAGTATGGGVPTIGDAGASAVGGDGSTTEGGAGGATGEAGAGGAPEPSAAVTITEGQMTPTGIAVDASYVYWSDRDAGTISKCPLKGCNGKAPTSVGSGLDTPLGLAVDATSVYWVNSGHVGGLPARLYKCPLSGCAGAPVKLSEWGVGHLANDVHVVGQTLYVAAWPMLATCSINGCATPTSLVGGPNVSVDTDAQYVYFGSYGTTTLERCPLAGCDTDNPRVVMASNVFPIAVAVDADAIYFANHDSLDGATPTKHEILKCPLAGCGNAAPEPVLSGNISPYGLTLNSTRLFFTNIVQGTVVSIPK